MRSALETSAPARTCVGVRMGVGARVFRGVPGAGVAPGEGGQSLALHNTHHSSRRRRRRRRARATPRQAQRDAPLACLTLLMNAYSSAALALVSPVRLALMSLAISATVSCRRGLHVCVCVCMVCAWCVCAGACALHT
jgi:hypothetical protein